MQDLTTCLWFDGQALEAAEFYTAIFPDGKITSVTHFGKAGFEVHKRPEGSVMTVAFSLNGQNFLGLNGGPNFSFSEAISIVINCDSQDEIDHYWNALTADGGAEGHCGWLKDKFGLSWQIVPSWIGELMSDPSRSDKAMAEIMTMRKIETEPLLALHRHEQG